MEKNWIDEACEKARALVYDAEDYIWKNPETGYREWKADAYLAERFEKLGYELKRAGDIPGFYTDIETGRPGPKLLIFGELDSLIVSDHPEADPRTGAVHACGHCCQSAVLLGIAAVLKEEGALDNLSGSIRLCAVPAEELIEINWRETLREQGTIHYYGGKTEFLYRGYFEDCDLSFMVHTASGPSHLIGFNRGGNGCVVKNATFKGLASHAGGAPEYGINALYIANVAFAATNALRETFPDNKHVRFHPIVTKGGDVVNAIPSEVKTESYVRGADIDIIKKISAKVNRAYAGAALAMGGNVRLMDRVGYFPLDNAALMGDAAEEVLKEIMGEGHYWRNDGWETGCTDMGDISACMPSLSAYCSGASGTGHGNDYCITDKESALMDSLRFQVGFAQKLLENNAEIAQNIVKNCPPQFESSKAYFELINTLVCDKDAVNYKTEPIQIEL